MANLSLNGPGNSPISTTEPDQTPQNRGGQASRPVQRVHFALEPPQTLASRRIAY
jgi:hypothetical protein